MAERKPVVFAVRAAAILGLGLALIGCQSIRQATGAAKLPPDEFTVLSKPPLVIPPDYNLRPPQPGIASRNDLDSAEQGRNTLFPQNAAAAAAALGTAYSDGEKLLLAKTNALSVDPNVRRSVTSDVGQEDQGPAFAQRVLFAAPGTTPATAAATAPAATIAPAAPTPPAAPANAPLPGTGQPYPPPNAAPRTP
jgi:hypothetical protein